MANKRANYSCHRPASPYNFDDGDEVNERPSDQTVACRKSRPDDSWIVLRSPTSTDQQTISVQRTKVKRLSGDAWLNQVLHQTAADAHKQTRCRLYQKGHMAVNKMGNEKDCRYSFVQEQIRQLDQATPSAVLKPQVKGRQHQVTQVFPGDGVTHNKATTERKNCPVPPTKPPNGVSSRVSKVGALVEQLMSSCEVKVKPTRKNLPPVPSKKISNTTSQRSEPSSQDDDRRPLPPPKLHAASATRLCTETADVAALTEATNMTRQTKLIKQKVAPKVVTFADQPAVLSPAFNRPTEHNSLLEHQPADGNTSSTEFNDNKDDSCTVSSSDCLLQKPTESSSPADAAVCVQLQTDELQQAASVERQAASVQLPSDDNEYVDGNTVDNTNWEMLRKTRNCDEPDGPAEPVRSSAGDDDDGCWSDSEWDDDVSAIYACSSQGDDDDNDSSTSGSVYMCMSRAKDNDYVTTGHHKANRRELIANELYESEKTYVARLYLLVQLHDELKRINETDEIIPEVVICKIFSNIRSIFHLHDSMLKELHQCTKQRDAHKRLGEVMRSHGPFFKLYAEYTQHFESATKALSEWQRKSAKFGMFISEFQGRPECESLAVQHHMMEPIQRLPRYELLLKDYLRNLPDNSDDKSDAEEALGLIISATTHCNERLQMTDKFKRLFEISRCLRGNVNLISPTRTLLKESKMHRVFENNKQKQRQVYLFNDLLLVCSISHLGLTVESELTLYKAKITGSNCNKTDPTGFIVKTSETSVHLRVSSLDEKEMWLHALVKAIEGCPQPLQSPSLELQDDSRRSVGPEWMRDEDADRCVICCTEFTFTFRRHHCRVCGIVVCGDCSNHRVDLLGSDNQRACSQCFAVLQQAHASLTQ